MSDLTTGWRKRQVALDKKAKNARELGLNYEPSIIEMAVEAGAIEMRDNDSMGWGCEFELHQLEAFAELIRADERNKTWTQSEWTEYERSIAAQEREECANVCDDLPPPEGYNIVEVSFWDVTSLACGDAIRARGTT
jgi:hypothetical protein